LLADARTPGYRLAAADAARRNVPARMPSYL